MFPISGSTRSRSPASRCRAWRRISSPSWPSSLAARACRIAQMPMLRHCAACGAFCCAAWPTFPPASCAAWRICIRTFRGRTVRFLASWPLRNPMRCSLLSILDTSFSRVTRRRRSAPRPAWMRTSSLEFRFPRARRLRSALRLAAWSTGCIPDTSRAQSRCRWPSKCAMRSPPPRTA